MISIDQNSVMMILLATVIILLTGLVFFAVFIYRRFTRGSFTAIGIEDKYRQLLRIGRPLVETEYIIDNPISRLSFAESFDGEKFIAASNESALNNINSQLRKHSANGILMTVNSVKLLSNGVGMEGSFSKEGLELLGSRKAVWKPHKSGKYLPILQDAKTGKFIEQAKFKPISRLSKLGTLYSAVLGAAYIITGADIAKRIKIIDSKLNLLLAYHGIEQLSKLERIYTSAKEMLNGPINHEKSWELWRLRGELRELRFNWCYELGHHLNLIDDPAQAGWFKRTFSRVKTKDRQINEKITECEYQIGLVDYSLRLDTILAAISCTGTEYVQTLSDELFKIDGIADLLENKSTLISQKYPDLNVTSTVKAMKDIVESYKQLTSPEPYQDYARLPHE